MATATLNRRETMRRETFPARIGGERGEVEIRLGACDDAPVRDLLADVPAAPEPGSRKEYLQRCGDRTAGHAPFFDGQCTNGSLAWRIRSDSRPNVFHKLFSEDGTAFGCDCEQHSRRRLWCHHMEAVQRLLDDIQAYRDDMTPVEWRAE